MVDLDLFVIGAAGSGDHFGDRGSSDPDLRIRRLIDLQSDLVGVLLNIHDRSVNPADCHDSGVLRQSVEQFLHVRSLGPLGLDQQQIRKHTDNNHRCELKELLRRRWCFLSKQQTELRKVEHLFFGPERHGEVSADER